MTDSPVLALTKDLISRQSVTPEDAGCQDVMIARLEALGFTIERMVFEDTTNFWARCDRTFYRRTSRSSGLHRFPDHLR